MAHEVECDRSYSSILNILYKINLKNDKEKHILVIYIYIYIRDEDMFVIENIKFSLKITL